MSSARLTDTAIGGNASWTGPVGPSIAVMRLVFPVGQHDDLVAGAHDAAGDGARIAAVVGVVVGLRPDHVLDREPDVDEVAVAGDVDLFEVRQQRRPVVPRRVVRLGHHVVAEQSRQRNRRHVVNVETRRELVEVVADLLELFAVPADRGPSC